MDQVSPSHSGKALPEKAPLLALSSQTNIDSDLSAEGGRRRISRALTPFNFPADVEMKGPEELFTSFFAAHLDCVCINVCAEREGRCKLAPGVRQHWIFDAPFARACSILTCFCRLIRDWRVVRLPVSRAYTQQYDDYANFLMQWLVAVSSADIKTMYRALYEFYGTSIPVSKRNVKKFALYPKIIKCILKYFLLPYHTNKIQFFRPSF